MRILYVFPEPLPLPKARGIQVVKTVAALAAQGQTVLLAYVPSVGGEDPFAHYGVNKPEHVVLLPMSRSLPGILGRLRVTSNKFFLIRLLAWLGKARAAGAEPECVFVRHLKLAAGLIRHAPHLPLVYEAHEVFADTAPAKKRKRLALLEHAVMQGARHVIAISSALATALRDRYGVPREMAVIPSAADLSEVDSVKDWAQAQNQIVYAGSFFAWKGVDDLVAAAAYLPGCTVTIIGGDETGIARLSALAPEQGARINFAGSLSHADTLKEIARACVAVLPNRPGSVSAYTSPLKLFEYMAAGCAIVVSDLPVFREILDDDEAAWFEAGNPEALAEAIGNLLQDRNRGLRWGQDMRQKAREYSWARRAELLTAILVSDQI